MKKIKYKPTPKKELRNLINEIQKGMDIYLKLPKRKQRKRKNREAYSDLMLLDRTLKEGYYRQLKIDDVQKWESTISKRNKLLNESLGMAIS